MRIKKETVDDIKYIALGILLAILINKALGVFLGTDLPVVAVVSESMTHDSTTEERHYGFLEDNFNYSRATVDSWPLKGGFRMGDVLVVKGVQEDEIEVGYVIVYNRKPFGAAPPDSFKVPIVHRVVQVEGGMLTKGDHNPGVDPWGISKIRGKAVLRIPLLGWPKVVLHSIIGGL